MESSGLKTKKLIEQGKKWRKKRIEEGYRDTPFGLLSPKEIEEAGFIYDTRKVPRFSPELNDFVMVERGYEGVPCQEYIKETTGDPGQPRGSKFIAPIPKFLAWIEKRKSERYRTKSFDDYIDEEMFSTKVTKARPIESGLDVDDIEF